MEEPLDEHGHQHSTSFFLQHAFFWSSWQFLVAIWTERMLSMRKNHPACCFLCPLCPWIATRCECSGRRGCGRACVKAASQRHDMHVCTCERCFHFFAIALLNFSTLHPKISDGFFLHQFGETSNMQPSSLDWLRAQLRELSRMLV